MPPELHGNADYGLLQKQIDRKRRITIAHLIEPRFERSPIARTTRSPAP